jgi:hypothetical protein
MWIGAIKLFVGTKDAPNAGTDDLIQAVVLRDGHEVARLDLNWAGIDDNERGDQRAYTYFNLKRKNDGTPELPPGLGQIPMPYPEHGIEFSNGIVGHLKIRLSTNGFDMWIKDFVDLSVREIRQKATSFDTLAWIEDSDWTPMGRWGKDVSMSWDLFEGLPFHTMKV